MTGLKDFLRRSVSKLALAAKPHIYNHKTNYVVSSKAGQKASIARRIIKQVKLPTLYIQTGWKRVGDTMAEPIMKAVNRHRFLHATKGWRVYSNGMPFANPPRFGGLPRNPSPLGKAHRVNVKQPGITIENKKNAKRVVLGWRPFKREDVAA